MAEDPIAAEGEGKCSSSFHILFQDCVEISLYLTQNLRGKGKEGACSSRARKPDYGV